MRHLQTPESMLQDWEQPTEAATESQTIADAPVPEEAAPTVTDPAPGPEGIQVSEPAVNPTCDHDDIDQERQMLDAIYKQTIKVAMMGIKERKLSSELEDLRAELSAAQAMKATLLQDLPDALLQLRDGNLPEPSDRVESSETETKVDTEMVDAGKNPTESILDGIPRLGPVKATAIADAFPTLADLDSARGEAVRSRQHFADVLPKGIGKDIADRLADRLIDALAGNNIPASEQVKETRVAKDDKAETSPAAESDPAAVDDNVQWAQFFASEIEKKEDFDSRHDSDAWREGYDAFEANELIEDVDHDAVDEFKMDWIRGWLAAQQMERQSIAIQEEDEAEEAAAEVAAEEPGSDPVNVAPDDAYEDVDDNEGTVYIDGNVVKNILSDDAREDFAEHVKSNGDTGFKHDQDAWQSGYEASLDDQPLEACPTSLTDDQESDWIRGWVEGSQLEVV